MTTNRSIYFDDSFSECVEITLNTTRLRRTMEARGINASKLSRLIGISRSAVSYLLTGKRQPGRQVLVALADNLSVSVDYLLGSSNGSNPVNHSNNRRITELVKVFCELSEQDQERIMNEINLLLTKPLQTEASLPSAND